MGGSIELYSILKVRVGPQLPRIAICHLSRDTFLCFPIITLQWAECAPSKTVKTHEAAGSSNTRVKTVDSKHRPPIPGDQTSETTALVKSYFYSLLYIHIILYNIRNTMTHCVAIMATSPYGRFVSYPFSTNV